MNMVNPTRWAPILVINGVMSDNPYKWPYNGQLGSKPLLIGVITVITSFITGSGAHLVVMSMYSNEINSDPTSNQEKP